jgi:hypothetical protein
MKVREAVARSNINRWSKIGQFKSQIEKQL